MYDVQLQFCYCVIELTWPVDLYFSFEGSTKQTHPLSAGQRTINLQTFVEDLLCVAHCAED